MVYCTPWARFLYLENRDPIPSDMRGCKLLPEVEVLPVRRHMKE